MKNLSLDEIVFENRNKAYGAYALRTTYAQNLTKSLLIGTSIMLSFFGGTLIYEKFIKKSEPIIHIANYDKTPIASPKIENIDPKNTNKKEFKTPKLVRLTVPIIGDNKTIEKPITAQTNIKTEIIGTFNVDGFDPEGIINEIPPKVTEPNKSPAPPENNDTPTIFSEISPEFPGGMPALYEFINSKINYPEAAVQTGTSGKVIVKFVIEKNGQVGNIVILKGIGYGCDEEAIRVINCYPNGNQEGKMAAR